MLNLRILDTDGSKRFRSAIALASLVALANVSGADFDASAIEWKFDAGLEKDRFDQTLEERRKAGLRIVDLEQYRSGRDTKQAAIWVKSMPSDEWSTANGLAVTEFRDLNEEQLKKGFALIDIEPSRIGATLNFGGVWLKNNEEFETEMHFGMNDLTFSNRYGEMADRGFRLIDFEAYESNGKTVYAAIWKPRSEEESVRFYRGLSKEDFGRISGEMLKQGFRLVDVEGYYVDGDLTFACAWETLEEGQKTDFAYHMLADEFYQKNARMMMDGYRLTDIEAYDFGRGELRYAGSWTTGKARVEAEPAKKKSSRSIFRRPE